MRTAGLSLSDLVAEAHARCPGLPAIQDWYDENMNLDGADQVWVAWESVEDALSAAVHGDYRAASRAAWFSYFYWSPGPEMHFHRYVGFTATTVLLNHFPAWRAFREACELAWRIDCFLAALSRDKLIAALARDCCQDLSVLLILADWAEENGRPASAAEARHLHGLVRYRG
jgi:hypothetical protein